jgi:UDP-N-acetylmuramoyl-L-alanyl-D-glutamate--2,6-diaminopimelate ligase
MTVVSESNGPVRLRALLPDAQFIGCADLSVAGLATSPSDVEPGQVYVAGATDRDFEITTALRRGAAAIISERFQPIAGHPQVLVDDANRAVAQIAQALAGDPSRRLEVIGVTGSQGKTETAWFLRSIQEADGLACGLMGPEDWSDGSRTRPIGSDPIHGGDVARVIAAMADRGCAAGVIELGQKSLERRACEATTLAGAIVGRLDWRCDAGLNPERLAARLLRAVSEDGLILLDSSEPASEILRAVRLDVAAITYGFEPHSDVTATIESMSLDATFATLHLPCGAIPLRIERPGLSAVRSALAAAFMSWQLGARVQSIRDGIEQVKSIPGRLERVGDGPIELRIDRARTGAEVARAIRTLREAGASQVHCVAGARHERDGSILENLATMLEFEADSVIVAPSQGPGDASDAAIDALLAHFRNPGRISRHGDRAAAIRAAYSKAQPGDVVLLAGRGDERTVGWAGAAALESDLTLALAVLDEQRDRGLRKIA